MDLYFGDVPLCYTNSLAMAFNSYGFHFSPEYLEALMVMGNGASFVDNNVKHPLVFFDNGLPDISINNCEASVECVGKNLPSRKPRLDS